LQLAGDCSVMLSFRYLIEEEMAEIDALDAGAASRLVIAA
jgi:hypothetical protein